MNKKDLIPIILLVLLIPAWMFIDKTFIAPRFPAKTPPAAQQSAGGWASCQAPGWRKTWLSSKP